MKRLAENTDFIENINVKDSKSEALTALQKFKTLWDEHDAEYFERMQTRKETAVHEYCIIQKAIQREKIKDTFKNQREKELYDKFDCIETPNMSDFEIIHFNRGQLIEIVKKISKEKKFKVQVDTTQLQS